MIVKRVSRFDLAKVLKRYETDKQSERKIKRCSIPINFGKSKNLHLPLLYTAYEILFKNCSIDSAIEKFRLKNLRGEF